MTKAIVPSIRHRRMYRGMRVLLIIFAILFSCLLKSCDASTYDFLDQQSEIFDQEAFYTPYPENKSNGFLPLCFAAQLCEKLSYFFIAYIIVSSGLKLNEDLHTINNTQYWPFTWFGKIGSYTECMYTIAKASIQIFMVRYASKIIIHMTCPKELCNKSLRTSSYAKQGK